MLANEIRGLFKAFRGLGQGTRELWARVRYDLFIILAWGLVTWGIFLGNARAWAISAGAYLIVNVALAMLAKGVKDVR